MPKIKQTTGPDQQTLERDGLAALTGADVVRSIGLDHFERLEIAKAGSLARQRRRLVATYGERSDEVKRHDVSSAAHSAQLAATRAEAQRARTPALKVSADEAVIHGRVVDASGIGVAGVVVVAGAARERPLGRDDTDANGYFRIGLPAVAAVVAAPGASGTVTLGRAAASPPPVAIQLSVLRRNKEIYRGDETFALGAGTAEYREIVLRTA
jgi:hypothetical protein